MSVNDATRGPRMSLRRAIARVAAVLALVAGPLTVAPAAHAYGPYGPYTCANSLVWREATPGDLVCVTPARRSIIWQENADAWKHVQPGGGPYGPDTCVQGYVWRETRPSDHVCVVPDSRWWASQDNRNAALGYANIAEIPANGTYSGWDGRMWVSGSGFTPNGSIAVYGWATDTRYMIRAGNALTLARSGGYLPTTYFTSSGCSLNYQRTMLVITVDAATGLVRNAGQQYIPCGWA
ncbi:hypothetical protein [Streptosporangium roseum]|uniref:hypothetical protein n=1 Tax=Streptosporangium roseum TaxID=2001 RepID=UPI00332ACE29